MKQLIPSVILGILLSTTSFAQGISMEQAVAFINKKTEGKYKLEVVRRQLIIDVFTEEGHIRQDKVMVDDLSWEKIKYYPKERSLVVRCEYEGDDCITRRLLIKGLKDHIHRFNFIVEDEKDAEAIKKAMIHIVKLVREKKYSSSEPFE